MNARTVIVAALGLATGFLLARLVPNRPSVTIVAVVLLLVLWVLARSRRAR